MVDGFRRGGEASLQDGQCKADGIFLVALQFLRQIELLADIIGHLFIELLFLRGKRVGDGRSFPLGEQRGSIEFQQIFLDETPHHVTDIAGRLDVIGMAGESVLVNQSHELLERGFVAVVGSGGQKEEMAGSGGEMLGKPVALGVGNLVAQYGSRAFVCLVDDDDVPMADVDFLRDFLVPGKFVQACD